MRLNRILLEYHTLSIPAHLHNSHRSCSRQTDSYWHARRSLRRCHRRLNRKLHPADHRMHGRTLRLRRRQRAQRRWGGGERATAGQRASGCST